MDDLEDRLKRWYDALRTLALCEETGQSNEVRDREIHYLWPFNFNFKVSMSEHSAPPFLGERSNLREKEQSEKTAWSEFERMVMFHSDTSSSPLFPKDHLNSKLAFSYPRKAPVARESEIDDFESVQNFHNLPCSCFSNDPFQGFRAMQYT